LQEKEISSEMRGGRAKTSLGFKPEAIDIYAHGKGSSFSPSVTIFGLQPSPHTPYRMRSHVIIVISSWVSLVLGYGVARQPGLY
jgi:hypothetical protein